MTQQVESVGEGFVDFRDFQVWYRTVGEGDTPPVLCLHGGPGASHRYLAPLEALATQGRSVLFYDQLGCGNSQRPDDPSLWNLDLYVEELDAVRAGLGLDRVHLFGHSSGAMIALQYALEAPTGVASLILASGTSSMPQWAAEAARQRLELPPDVRAALERHERAGTTDDPEYEDAQMAFYARHICRLDPWPDFLIEAFADMNQQIYASMWGESEFRITGNLAEWDVTTHLSAISLPTLITAGRYDHATPEMAETLHRRIAHSELVVFENSAHLPHIEESDRYMEVVADFLSRAEKTVGSSD